MIRNYSQWTQTTQQIISECCQGRDLTPHAPAHYAGRIVGGGTVSPIRHVTAKALFDQARQWRAVFLRATTGLQYPLRAFA